MKNLNHLAPLFLLIVLPLVSLAQQTMPQEIQEFYKKLNFVNAYSTPAERSLLKSCHDISQVPYTNGSDRLRKIYQAMQVVDKGILQSKDRMPGMHKYEIKSFTSGLYQVLKYVISDDGSAKIWVKVYQIDQESQSHFIAYYNKALKYDWPSVEKLVDMAHVTSFNQEANEWFLTRDGWKKGTVNMVLVH